MPNDVKTAKNEREENLIRACQRNERRAQSEFYRLYSGKFLGIAYRFAGDYDVANDLLQEGFIRIFSHINEYKFKGSFEGWMRRIIITTSINYIRKHYQVNFEDITAGNYPEHHDLNGVIDKMNCEEIIEEINKLPHGFRTILNLYAIDGYSYTEIAAMLEVKEVTVRTQYLRAKQKLAAALGKKKIIEYATKIV